MSSHRAFHRGIAIFVATLFLLTSLSVPAAQAGMISTGEFAQTEQTEMQRQDIANFLERDDVRDQLVSWGVDVNQAQDRVGSMTAAEVSKMHAQMGDMPVGAGGGIVGAIVLIFLVLLITDILGFTNVFPFTR